MFPNKEVIISPRSSNDNGNPGYLDNPSDFGFASSQREKFAQTQDEINMLKSNRVSTNHNSNKAHSRASSTG
jgi:hypothetical protein